MGVADQGNGTYQNPILHADYSDPDAVRRGSDFYMTASSFNASPGLPILHSRDLVNWDLIGHAYGAQPRGHEEHFDHRIGLVRRGGETRVSMTTRLGADTGNAEKEWMSAPVTGPVRSIYAQA